MQFLPVKQFNTNQTYDLKQMCRLAKIPFKVSITLKEILYFRKKCSKPKHLVVTVPVCLAQITSAVLFYWQKNGANAEWCK